MIDYLIKNIEWIFSGVGATILAALIAFFSKRKKMKSLKSKLNTSKQNVDNSTISNSQFTNVIGESINYHQNIYSNDNKDYKNLTEEVPVINSEDLVRTKEDFLSQKKRLRTFIYRVITPAKNINKIVEVRHVVDAAEEKLKIDYKVIMQELKEMMQEGLIELLHDKDTDVESPYTRIKLTNKFFMTIKAKT